MVDFISAENEAESIAHTRDIFRSYVPESDAWAEPNFFSINATIMGGLAWSAVNEARNGIDARANPQTAVGEALDILAGAPPLFLTRMAPTQAVGDVDVSIPTLASIPAGYTFTSAAGVTYTATETVPLVAGVGMVPVVSSASGADQNSPVGQQLTASDEGTVLSLGIVGGMNEECDDALRQRMFSERQTFCAFGSTQWYLNTAESLPEVSRVWPVDTGLGPRFAFVTETDLCCGDPTQAQIDAVNAYFQDECRASLCFCPVFEAARTESIAPQITWSVCPDDFQQIEDALTQWLRDNYEMAEGIRACDVEDFLQQSFPEFGPSLDCCADWPAKACVVYNCAEILGD